MRTVILYLLHQGHQIYALCRIKGTKVFSEDNPNLFYIILFSTMKVPGEAWLEFQIEQVDDGYLLVQTATFRPQGLLGRLYWYALYPVHYYIFHKMGILELILCSLLLINFQKKKK